MPDEAILVVEDEAIVAVDIQQALEGLGYRVVGPVASGEEALARFEAERADLVLMDVHLRGAMDGIEAAALFRDRFGVPVVYLTAYADQETLRRAGATAPFSYLVKPFLERDLHAAVEMAFQRHRLEAALRDANLELERRVAERTAEIRNLQRITAHINAGLLLDDVLDNVYDDCRGIIPYDRIGLALIEEKGERVRCRWARTALGSMRLKVGYESPLAGTSLESIIRTGQPRIINDLEAYLARKPTSGSTRLMVAEGMRASLTCPLVVGGAPTGFLFFSSREPDAYAEVHVEIFQMIADQLSVTIERGRLVSEMAEQKAAAERQSAEIQRLNQQLEARVTERTARLVASAAWLRAILTSVPEAVVTIESDGTVTSFNPAAERAFEYPAAEVVGRNVSMLMPSPHREEHDGHLERYLRTGEAHVIGKVREAEGRRKDGTAFPVELWVQTMEHKGRRSFVATLRDLTERKRAESTLRRSEERFRRVIEHIQDALIIDDLAGRIVFANQRFADLLGCDLERALQLTLEDYAAPEWRKALRDRHDRRVRGESVDQDFEFEAVRADGKRLWLEVSVVPVVDESGATTGTQAALRDVSDRKRVQEALRTAAKEWQRTFDSIDVALVLIGSDGRILRLNQAAQRLSGESYRELVGIHLRELPPTGLWREAAEWALQPADARTPRAIRIGDDDGTGRAWDVRMSEVADPDPQASRWLIVAAVDVTDTVRMEAALRRSETMAAIGALASGVAHEVRGPLFALSANLDALEPGSDAALVERLKPLRRSAARLNALMEDLLDFSRPSAGSLANGPLAGVIREAREDCLAMAESGGVSIVSDPEPAPGHVLMDRERLRQVFVNVVGNAVQHSPRNGTLRIEFERFLESGREWVRCLVSDQGPGFRKEELERVFEPFFTRRKGGTGLGLAIAKRIVEAHGGRIEARNRPGGGACVIVALPAADE